MPIHVILGEPLWREAGRRKVTVDLGGRAELPLETLLEEVRVEALSADPAAGTAREMASESSGTPEPVIAQESAAEPGGRSEAGLLVIVNGRALPPGQLRGSRVQDGDEVVLQQMFSGG